MSSCVFIVYNILSCPQLLILAVDNIYQGGLMQNGKVGTGSSVVQDEASSVRWVANRPQSPEDQIRTAVMYAFIRAGEMFRADRDLENCYLILPRSANKLPEKLFVRRNVVDREADRAFLIERPVNGTDMRGLTSEEVIALGRFPKIGKKNPDNQNEAVVRWVADRYGVELRDRELVVVKTPPVVNRTVPTKMPPLVAGPKNKKTVINVAAQELAAPPLVGSELDGIPELSVEASVTPIRGGLPTSSLLSVALKIESRLAIHFASASAADECHIGIWEQDGQIKFVLKDSEASWPNGQTEIVMSVNRDDTKTTNDQALLRENLMLILEKNFGHVDRPMGSLNVVGLTQSSSGVDVVAAPTL